MSAIAKFLAPLARTLRGVADVMEPPRAADSVFRHLKHPGPSDVLDNYVIGAPSAQNAVDALPGWNMALPPQAGARVEGPAFYCDARIEWALQQFGPLEGKHVLELGPLEASHTFMLEGRNPASLTAIEANRLSFLRCLVVKELVGLKTANFLLGNFEPWLETTDRRFDLVVASGVLYHMAEPVRLIEQLARHTDALYLWTHYASDTAMPIGDARNMLLGPVEVVESHGVKARLYPRSYLGAWKNKAFCGGPHDHHRWIERDDLLELLKALGFTDLRIAHDDPQHVNGPAFSIFARRPPS